MNEVMNDATVTIEEGYQVEGVINGHLDVKEFGANEFGEASTVYMNLKLRRGIACKITRFKRILIESVEDEYVPAEIKNDENKNLDRSLLQFGA